MSVFLQISAAKGHVDACSMHMAAYLHDDVVLAFVNQPSRVCEGPAPLRHNGLNLQGPLQTQHCCPTLHTKAPHRSAQYQQTCVGSHYPDTQLAKVTRSFHCNSAGIKENHN